MKLPEKIQTDIRKVNRVENRFFRDMIWLIYSDGISINNLTDYSFRYNTIDSLIEWQQSTEEKSLNLPKNLPLGKYAEALILFYLKNHPGYELMGHNIQLIENKTTLGEIDFLFRETNSIENIHLELALKYYLKTKRGGNEIFLGPSTRDFLSRKVKKLISHQSQLCKTYAHLLPGRLQTHSFTPRICVKGSLFQPYNDSVNYQSDWWMPLEKIDSLKNEHYSYTLITDKKEWIFPFSARLKKMTFNSFKSQTLALLNQRDEIMVSRFNRENEAVDRGFVVRPDWPD